MTQAHGMKKWRKAAAGGTPEAARNGLIGRYFFTGPCITPSWTPEC